MGDRRLIGRADARWPRRARGRGDPGRHGAGPERHLRLQPDGHLVSRRPQRRDQPRVEDDQDHGHRAGQATSSTRRPPTTSTCAPTSASCGTSACTSTCQSSSHDVEQPDVRPRGSTPANSTFVRDGIYPAYETRPRRLSSRARPAAGSSTWGWGSTGRSSTSGATTPSRPGRWASTPMLDVFKDMRFDPANPNGNTAVGLGYHQLIWSTWVSKRFRYFDPYFGASYMLPIRTNGSIYQDLGGGQTRSTRSRSAAVVIGVEQIAWENPATPSARDRRGARPHRRSTSPAAAFSELWEPLIGSSACPAGSIDLTGLPACRPSLDQVTQSPAAHGAVAGDQAAPYPGVSDIDAYGSFGGDVGLNVQVGKYIRFRSLFGLTSRRAPLHHQRQRRGRPPTATARSNSTNPRRGEPGLPRVDRHPRPPLPRRGERRTGAWWSKAR